MCIKSTVVNRYGCNQHQVRTHIYKCILLSTCTFPGIRPIRPRINMFSHSYECPILFNSCYMCWQLRSQWRCGFGKAEYLPSIALLLFCQHFSHNLTYLHIHIHYPVKRRHPKWLCTSRISPKHVWWRWVVSNKPSMSEGKHWLLIVKLAVLSRSS